MVAGLVDAKSFEDVRRSPHADRFFEAHLGLQALGEDQLRMLYANSDTTQCGLPLPESSQGAVNLGIGICPPHCQPHGLFHIIAW